MIVDAADLDSVKRIVTIRASNSEQKRHLVDITLPECFADAELQPPSPYSNFFCES